MPAEMSREQAERKLDELIESRISLALTPAMLTKLALRGVSEEDARKYLRARVNRTLDERIRFA